MSKLRTIVAGLAEMGDLTLRGRQYTGPYLSQLLAVNMELPEDEANRTPQLVSELGRLTAAALYEKEMAEVRYRVWRDGVVFDLTNDLAAARSAGFASVCEPGVDAKGNDKPPKLPTASAVDAYVRKLPEYRDHYKAMARAAEVWGSFHAAYEGAQARVWTIKAWEKTGGTSPRERSTAVEADDANEYHPGDGDASAHTPRTVDRHNRGEFEAHASGARTPLPPVTGAPPPPPGHKPPSKTPPRRKRPPTDR